MDCPRTETALVGGGTLCFVTSTCDEAGWRTAPERGGRQTPRSLAGTGSGGRGDTSAAEEGKHPRSRNCLMAEAVVLTSVRARIQESDRLVSNLAMVDSSGFRWPCHHSYHRRAPCDTGDLQT